MSSQCFADPLFFVGLPGPLLSSFGNQVNAYRVDRLNGWRDMTTF